MAIDLFCGLGGWSEGFLAEGYECIGFDNHRHDYGTGGYPGQLVLQDVLTLHGSQFKDAAVIVASPPCQEFSYMAMPWKRGKQIAACLTGELSDEMFPDGYKGSRDRSELTALFDACFRIQREASEAAGHHIPLVVENVKGAQPWVGQAKAHFGSFYLWGDVGMVGGAVVAGRLRLGEYCAPVSGRAQKNNGGGSWFAISHGKDNGKLYGDNPVRGEGIDGRKVPSMMSWDQYGKPGYQPQGFNVEAAKRHRQEFGWRNTAMDKGTSKSDSRKAASAQIAKIPFALARYIARAFKPIERAA